MLKRKYLLMVFAVILLLWSLPVSTNAQGDTLGQLTVGQPQVGEITAGGTAPRYGLTVTQPSAVSLQAFGETVQPTITVLRGGELVSSEPNVAGAFVAVLSTFLSAGDYVVEAGAANGTTGTVILVVQSESPVSITDLQLASTVSGTVSGQVPVALYRLTALGEPSSVFVSSVPSGGVKVRLVNQTTSTESGTLGTDLLGGRFDIPANSASYQLEVEHGGSASPAPFTVCWASASAGGCGSAPAAPTAVPAAPAATPEVQVEASNCTVSPTASSVNVRASASTSAPILASLQAGVFANVLGISPDGFFYNVLVNGVNGWVAVSVVAANGDCSNVPTVNPPQFVPVATQIPTLPPQPTQAPQPTQPPQPTATEVPSGPCLLTLNSPVYVYTQPTAEVDYLFDQVQSGELIPVGKLADNSWWKTNYGNAWVQTGLFGGAITVSGNCGSLPVVSP